MCHSDDSAPPTAPDAGEVAAHGPVELTGADGNTFAAYRATPGVPNGASMVILPDVRGLHPFYIRLAQRFAEAGYEEAVAMDYFGRTAGVSQRDESFPYTEHLPSLTPDQVRSDAAAAVAAVRAANPDGPVFTVGFCYGGSSSWRLSASDLDLAGVIGFYGKPERVSDVVDRMHLPLLLLVAGADFTPVAEFEAFADQLKNVGVEYEMHVYDAAPHSFFDRAFDEWADACTDAWQRILAFTAAHSA